MGKLLQDYNYSYFEEPVFFDWLAGTKQVADVLSMPNAGPHIEFKGDTKLPIDCPGPANLYAPFGWADLPIPPPERVVKNRWTKTAGAKIG